MKGRPNALVRLALDYNHKHPSIDAYVMAALYAIYERLEPHIVSRPGRRRRVTVSKVTLPPPNWDWMQDLIQERSAEINRQRRKLRYDPEWWRYDPEFAGGEDDDA